MKTFDYSKVFKGFRRLHNLKQVELAKLLECDQTRVAKIENLNRKPSPDEILHLLYISGLDPYPTIEGLDQVPTTEIKKAASE